MQNNYNNNYIVISSTAIALLTGGGRRSGDHGRGDEDQSADEHGRSSVVSRVMQPSSLRFLQVVASGVGVGRVVATVRVNWRPPARRTERAVATAWRTWKTTTAKNRSAFAGSPRLEGSHIG